MTITRFHNTPLGEFIRMIENKHSDSDILNECVVRLQQLEDLQPKQDAEQSIQCPHCEGTINVEVNDGKVQVIE